MILYFCLIYIAAFLGHRKARLLVQGQRETQRRLREGSNIYKDCIWFHAASVGEFEQARPIIERLKAEQPQQKILLTFFSPSGYEMRKHYDKADAVLYLPFATRRNAKRFVEAVCPRKVIFVKYEFWPAYLRLFKQKRIPAYSISAIFRPTQLFFRPWGKAYLDLLRCFRHIYVQDSESLRLLQSHGITHCSVAGDTRFDRVNYLATHAAAPDGALLPFEVPKKLLVAGSTWPQDEALLERVAVYFAYRSILKCVNDGDLLGRGLYTVLLTLAAERIAAVCGLSEALRRLSREVEHDQENGEALLSAFRKDADFSVGRFLRELRG